MLCAVRMQAFFRWFYPLQGGYLLVGVVVPLIVTMPVMSSTGLQGRAGVPLVNTKGSAGVPL